MWESPINVMEIQDSFVSEIKEKTEEMVFTEIKRIGIEVDKEEMIKALMYDRNRYEKGYKDGYNKAIDEFVEKLNTDVESFVAEVDGVKADLLTFDYFSEFVFEVADELKGVQE